MKKIKEQEEEKQKLMEENAKLRIQRDEQVMFRILLQCNFCSAIFTLDDYSSRIECPHS